MFSKSAEKHDSSENIKLVGQSGDLRKSLKTKRSKNFDSKINAQKLNEFEYLVLWHLHI